MSTWVHHRFFCGVRVAHLVSFCLHIVVSNTYCVVFLFCFSSSCVPYVASSSGLSFFDCPFSILTFIYETCTILWETNLFPTHDISVLLFYSKWKGGQSCNICHFMAVNCNIIRSKQGKNQGACNYIHCNIIHMTTSVLSLEWVSDCCLPPTLQFFSYTAISWLEQVNFQWNDNEGCFVLDQHA